MLTVKLVLIPPTGILPADIGPLSEFAEQARQATLAVYEAKGFTKPWGGYLAVRDGTIVGTCAFKAPPKDGRVEIAYWTFPGFEGQGISTLMARKMGETGVAAGLVVVAQTLPEQNASNGILKKLGFRFAGEVRHPEDGRVWEWRLSPAAPSALNPSFKES